MKTPKKDELIVHVMGSFYLWTRGDRFALGFLVMSRDREGKSNETCSLLMKGRFA